jgi:nicotinamidase-related amidase
MSEIHDQYVQLQQKRNAAPVSLQMASTALIVIDMQEYFFNPQSALNRLAEAQSPGIRSYFHNRVKTVVVPNIRKLLTHFRSVDGISIFTTMASETHDGRDLPRGSQAMNERALKEVGETWMPSRSDAWARIIEPLAPQPDEVVINKTTYSCFTSTGLDGSLRNMGVETLILCGVVTNRCVETTARDAADLGYQSVVVDDATATHSPETQIATMLSLMGPYASVRTTDETLSTISASA